MKNGHRPCFWERVCIEAGFKLIHDGQRNPGQFTLPPEDVRYYTRKYQWYLDGEPVNTFVTFIYDERELFDIRVSYKDGRDKGEIFTEVKHEDQNRVAGAIGPARDQQSRI